MATFDEYGIDTKGKRGNIRTICPKCSHDRKNPKDPCLSVDTEKACWLCHNCHWSGGLGRGLGLHRDRRVYKKPVFTPSPLVHPQLGEWFRKRGIMPETIKAAQVKLTKKYFQALDTEVQAIQFPYFRGGE
ncbi:MAG: hypothetical protein KC584_10790, partial [Nitrospira sp.]|nr:hypothetical protein [Nitrospira sp.]